MNRNIFGATLAVVLAIGVAIGYWIAKERAAPDSAVGASADVKSMEESERRALYWYDPMRPEVKFDKPGKSPFMDMELVPRYADKEGTAAVRIDPALAQNLGIRLGTVEKAVLAPRLGAVGSVAFDERRLHVVQARVEGYVTRLHVKAPLERVRRGEPLAEIQAPDWLAADLFQRIPAARRRFHRSVGCDLARPRKLGTQPAMR